MLIVARLLGAHDFGGLVAVQGTVTLLSSLVSYAMRLTASSEFAAARHDHARLQGALAVVTWTTFVGAAILTVVCAALSGWLAETVLARPALGAALRIGSLLVLVDCIGALQLGMLTGLGALRGAAVAGIVASTLLVVATAAGAAWDGIDGALWGLVIGGLAGVLLRGWPVHDQLRGASLKAFGRLSRTSLTLLQRVSLPILLLNVVWTPAIWLATVMLVRAPGGYAEAGHLGAASQWFAALLFLPNILGFSTLPLLSSQVAGDGNFETTRKLALRTALLAAVPSSLLVAMASPLIMGIYGPEYRAAWPALALLALASVPAAIFAIQANVLTATGQRRKLVGAQVAWAAAYLAVAALLLQLGWGAAALAGAMLAGCLARTVYAGRQR